MNDQQVTALIAGLIYAARSNAYLLDSSGVTAAPDTYNAVQDARTIMDHIYKTEDE